MKAIKQARGLDAFMSSRSPVVEVMEVICPPLWVVSTEDGADYAIARRDVLKRYGSIEKFQEALDKRKEKVK